MMRCDPNGGDDPAGRHDARPLVSFDWVDEVEAPQAEPAQLLPTPRLSPANAETRERGNKLGLLDAGIR
jgi:hypothetical protein